MQPGPVRLVGSAEFTQQRHALSTAPQVALAGPPGTGKTWVAEHLALHLTGGRRDAVHVVQFHPTFSYEDFVEGLRPVPGAGGIAFDVVPGPLVEAAEQAENAEHPVVLVIDEMNRANLPGVFGELLYLLEYRNKPIDLLHRKEFALPHNMQEALPQVEASELLKQPPTSGVAWSIVATS